MGKRTSIYLTDDLLGRIQRSNMTPVRLIELGLTMAERRAAPTSSTTPTTPPTSATAAPTRTTSATRTEPGSPAGATGTTSGTTSTSTGTTGTTTLAPRLVTYTAIKNGLNLRAGWPFTAADVASTLDIPAHLARGRLAYLVQLGMAKRTERSTAPGHPWRYKLVRVTPKQLCEQAQCDHERHLAAAQPAA